MTGCILLSAIFAQKNHNILIKNQHNENNTIVRLRQNLSRLLDLLDSNGQWPPKTVTVMVLLHEINTHIFVAGWFVVARNQMLDIECDQTMVVDSQCGVTEK